MEYHTSGPTGPCGGRVPAFLAAATFPFLVTASVLLLINAQDEQESEPPA